MDALFRARLLRVDREQALADGANPHIADERLIVPDGYWPGDCRLFARGRVRHIDHATLEFAEWRRVAHNRERPLWWTITPWRD